MAFAFAFGRLAWPLPLPLVGFKSRVFFLIRLALAEANPTSAPISNRIRVATPDTAPLTSWIKQASSLKG